MDSIPEIAGLMDLAHWTLLAEADGGGGRGAFPFDMLLPFVAIFFLFYFLMIRPERRKRAEMSLMLENLKKNDRVVTIGGIHGVVVNVQKGSNDVTIRVDENTRLRVLRTAISRVLSDEDVDDKKDPG
jgi:preprotein translocase subunit YajC